jgi:chitinase
LKTTGTTKKSGTKSRFFGTLLLVTLLTLTAVVSAVGGFSATSPASVYAASEWAAGVSYKVGDIVTYQGKTYSAIQAHTSLTGWEPPNVPALWQLQGGSNPTPTVSNPTATPTVSNPTPTPTSGTGTGCNVPAYNPNSIYTGGQQVSYNGRKWQARWWTQGETPSTGGSGVWQDLGACGTSPTVTPTPTVPNPTATPTSTPTGPTPTPRPNDGKLPKHAMIGYWHNFVNGSTNLRLRDVSPNYDLIIVAFAEADATNPGGVTFGVDSGLSSALGGYTDANLIADIATLKSRGKKVILSIGGERGTVNLGSASPNVSNFVNSFYGLMTRFGFDGLDIDLENGLNVTNLTNATRQLQQRAGAGFILTMAPQTLDVQPGGVYMQLINNLKDILTVVHTQYYNSGAMNGCDGRVYSQGSVDFITAQACFLLQILRADQVALGFPAVPSAAGSGYVSPTIVNNALDCLATGTNCGTFRPSTTYPSIRGVMDWSINWDATVNYAFSNAVRAKLNALP